jgi:hypothetical protein
VAPSTCSPAGTPSPIPLEGPLLDELIDRHW